MSLTLGHSATTAPDAGERLLRGLDAAGGEPGLAAHLRLWGDLPRWDHRFIDELEGSGLVGHGGAWFPVATKWRSVAEAGRRRAVVVANGAEGEPASRKDALLLSPAPHLVLDGLSLAARALGAQRAVAYVPSRSVASVEAAVAERRAPGLDPLEFEIAVAPDAYISGQESAVVNGVAGDRRALPSFVGLSSIRERGVGARPTLVQNVETLAHVALVARFGAAWFRGVGTPDEPGTVLLTVYRPDRPLVVEAALGSSLCRATGLGPKELAGTRGVLLGGYGGGWVSPKAFADLIVSERAADRQVQPWVQAWSPRCPPTSAPSPRWRTWSGTWRARAPASAAPASTGWPNWRTTWSAWRTAGREDVASIGSSRSVT